MTLYQHVTATRSIALLDVIVNDEVLETKVLVLVLTKKFQGFCYLVILKKILTVVNQLWR